MARITVIGSYVTDLTGRTEKLPRPGETVIGRSFTMGPGGKGGNQAVAAARLGSDVTMVTKIGKDVFGEEAVRNFQAEKIRSEYVAVTPDAATGAAIIAVDDQGENMIVVTLGACGTLSADEVQQADAAIASSDYVLVQLETSIEAVEEAVRLAGEHRKPVILNPAPYHPVPEAVWQKVAYATPNETEAEGMTGVTVTDKETADHAARRIQQMGVENVIITLGKKGCYLLEQGQEGRLIPGIEVDAVDTTGAGDAFNGALAHYLGTEPSVEEACYKANVAAALSVTRAGTAPSMARAEEVASWSNK
ncbi:ribokinase [Alkalicoccus urumqiensis]|uniref:Ribokinase n=1 Tax=Alkalicoccus urumqiensis TaxID=1548213 RepID=A0A2P6ML88_ALKUR|nr:ribokinase [Alkalicoccus urumqiensis]PRO67039.1 ribokinase [Alkalicoccus urumqiensis]